MTTIHNHQSESAHAEGLEYRSALRLAHSACDQLRKSNSELLDRLTWSHRREYCYLVIIIAHAAYWVFRA